MRECECPYLPEKYHYVYYGITEPGSMQEYNPYCPEHGELPREEPGMNDIISRAKELLKGATSGPWIAADSDIIAPDNGFIGTISEYSGLIDGSEEQANTLLAAAAPKMAQALAEEKWEYTAQVHMYNRSWVYMWSPTSGNSVYGKWHATRELAEKFAEQWQLDYPTRIVRRRVSTVEVVNE